MDLGLAGKRILVGGGSRGLGYAVAEELVAQGARVLLVARAAEVLDRAVHSLGAQAEGIVADLASAEDADRVADRVRASGGLDGILVNGGGPAPGTALTVADSDWDRAYRLLIAGPIRLLRSLSPAISEGGSILFVTSSSVRQPIPNLDTSNVLRPGVAALVKCLAQELGPRLRVNSIAPGRFDTDRVRGLDEGRSSARGISLADFRAQFAQSVPLRRYGQPAEFARAAVFLLSPAASYISGTALQVDGGMVTAIP